MFLDRTIYNEQVEKFKPQKHHRRSIRLPHYDYSQPGAYFVTIVAWQRECLFGEIVNAETRLYKIGKIVESEWLALPKRFSSLELGAWVIMPNHFHGILWIHENVRATRHGPTRAMPASESVPTVTAACMDGSPLPHGPRPGSLGAILAQFKSRVTKRVWKIPEYKETPIWHRNYYEHIIRNETDLQNITDYIESNPVRWEQDREHSSTPKTEKVSS
jgi:REP element-mobilizing transposase RayT